jgi:electron transfer flavoprotein beta subunit
LAIGADDAIRVNVETTDAYSIASHLADAIRNENFDLILCGIESSDHNGSTVGGMLAEFLGYPSVTGVSSVTFENAVPLIIREIDGGKEILTVNPPLVAVVQKGIAREPRIAAMRGIMMARTKPIKVVEVQGIDCLTEVVGYELPKPRAACKYVNADDAGQLIALLQNEAKVF